MGGGETSGISLSFHIENAQKLTTEILMKYSVGEDGKSPLKKEKSNGEQGIVGRP